MWLQHGHESPTRTGTKSRVDLVACVSPESWGPVKPVWGHGCPLIESRGPVRPVLKPAHHLCTAGDPSEFDVSK